MKKNSTTKQPLEDSKNAKPVLRDSGYRDYVAVDMVDERGLIVSTPFYIKEGQTIEAHWPKPSNEQPKNPIHYDDFNDVFQFLMEDGEIHSKWANSGLNSVFEIMNKEDLLTWEFHKARKIKVIEQTPTPDSKEGLHTQDCLFMGTTTKLSDGGYEAIIQVKRGDGLQDDLNIHVWHPTKGEAEANAELIVEAVNERKALLDSHRELLDALIHAQNVIDRLDDEYRDLAERHSSYTRGDFKKIETAINNAKNIK